MACIQNSLLALETEVSLHSSVHEQLWQCMTYIQWNKNILPPLIINTAVLQKGILANGVFGWCSGVFRVTREDCCYGTFHISSLESFTSLYPCGIVCERKRQSLCTVCIPTVASLCRI